MQEVTVNPPISPPPVASLVDDGPEGDGQEGGLLEDLQYFVEVDQIPPDVFRFRRNRTRTSSRF